MTREIMIPQSYVRVINVKKTKKTASGKITAPVISANKSYAVKGEKNTRTVRAEGTERAARKNIDKSLVKANVGKAGRIAKNVGRILFTILCAVIYAILYVADAFNFVWLCIQEKCGEVARKVGSEGLFGEADDGYYHTEDGFRLKASAITVKSSKK